MDRFNPYTNDRNSKIYCCECHVFIQKNTQCAHFAYPFGELTVTKPRKFLCFKWVSTSTNFYNYVKCHCGFCPRIGTRYHQRVNINGVTTPGVTHDCAGANVTVIWTVSRESLAKMYGHYKHDDCPNCNSTGQVSQHVYEKCNNCDGMGGNICAWCKGKSCTKCTNGYINVCHVCNGTRSVIISTATIVCTKCKDFGSKAVTPYTLE